MEILAIGSEITLLLLAVVLAFISIYSLVKRKDIVAATLQAKRDLRDYDSGIMITHGAVRANPGSRGLRKDKKLSKLYLNTL